MAAKPKKPRAIKRGVAWDADLHARLVKLARQTTFSRVANDAVRRGLAPEKAA